MTWLFCHQIKNKKKEIVSLHVPQRFKKEKTEPSWFDNWNAQKKRIRVLVMIISSPDHTVAASAYQIKLKCPQRKRQLSFCFKMRSTQCIESKNWVCLNWGKSKKGKLASSIIISSSTSPSSVEFEHHSVSSTSAYKHWHFPSSLFPHPLPNILSKYWTLNSFQHNSLSLNGRPELEEPRQREEGKDNKGRKLLS